MIQQELEAFILDEFNQFRERVIAEYDQKGMRASGDFEKNTTVAQVVSDTKIKTSLIAPEYVRKLEQGQKVGDKVASVAEIERWAVQKGIIVNGNIRGFALAVVRKHKAEGWDREDFGGVNLLTDVNVAEFLDQLIVKIKPFVVNLVTQNILQAWQK